MHKLRAVSTGGWYGFVKPVKSMKARWTALEVPDQQGRTAVVTGANTGLGFEVAKVLAARGALVVLAGRDVNKLNRAAAHIAGIVPGANVAVQTLDLASLASVRAAARELQAKHPKISLLINNAGVLYTPKVTTIDGFELQFATNHLGAFALAGLLLKRMLEVPGSRVIAVSSIAHRGPSRINFEDLQWQRTYSRVAAYGQSKLANLMFTYELQRRLSASGARTIAVVAHPGLARTEIMRNSPAFIRALMPILMPFSSPITQSAEMGALPILRAATDPGVLGGQYYGPGGRWLPEFKGPPVLVSSTEQSRDPVLQRRLWAVSEELTGVSFPV
jgi:NAD(P)-dependent dehydrogenase (short-subunit alcohol dehydrogenase family)